jgi:ferrochelatase
MATASWSADPAEDPAGDGAWAVLLLAYGAPGSLDDVEPYLADVRGGRPTPPELVEEMRDRYRAIGGRSPLLERTLEQARALERALGGQAAVRIGMRHWHPYLSDVLAAMARDGVRRVVALPLAPHASRLSVGAYAERVAAARGPMEVAFVGGFHDHPGFLDAVAERTEAALARLPAEERDAAPVLFTAHSLPSRILPDGDPYLAQIEASVAGVLSRLGPRTARIGLQSAGRSAEPWLGPDAAAVLMELAVEHPSVVLCPIGFVSDHLEVLYDVDVEYRALAARLGVRLERTESLNASPTFVAALADLVRRAARTRGWEPCASR